MNEKILDILKNSGDYVSGGRIANRLGVSRSAVWKSVSALRRDGFAIDAVPNRGYKLMSSPDSISEYGIKSGLKTIILGQTVKCFYETDSTNNAAKRGSDMPNGTVFAAEIQTGGKGRLGREWISPEGGGIWMSLLLKPDTEPFKTPQITLLAGLAVCRALKDYGAMIKWPNDIIIGTKKVCGILTEMSAEMERVNYIICGIGINVNIGYFPSELSGKATSLFIETGRRHNRCEIIRRVLGEFEPLYFEYLKNGLKNIISEYKSFCVNIGRENRAVFAEREISGTVKDIDENGSLVIESGGETFSIFSGEASVRGIYGYI